MLERSRKKDARRRGDTETRGTRIAPHPRRANRSEWMSKTNPRGLVELLIQSLEGIGARLTKDIKIKMKGEQHLEILKSPSQAVEHR